MYSSNLDAQSPQQSPKPIVPPIKADAIPAELKATKRWVSWRYEYRTNTHGDGKWTKVPLDPKTLFNAKSDDPSTWGSFDNALYKWKHLHHDGRVDGVGFMLGDGWAGIDIDNCLGADQNFIIDAAPDVIKNLDTYTEISPSGRGVKMLFQANTGKGRKLGGLECYSQGRFFTITGHHLPATPAAPQPRQQQADDFLAIYFDDDTEPVVVNHSNFTPQPVTDKRLKDALERACQRPYGERFRRLWRGDWQGLDYPSQAEADCAILNYLSYELGPDPQAIDALFRQSGLMRLKWDSKRGSSTWGRQRIDFVLAGLTKWHEERALVSIEDAGNELLTDGDKTSPLDLYGRYFMDTTQFFQAATDDKVNYLVEPILQQGGVNMISGQSFAGKTVFLLWLLGKLMRGCPIFTHRTNPCDVVYLNGDLNPLHRLSGYLSAGLEGDLTTPAFHYLRQSPDTLTADYLGTLCDVVWSKRGKDKPVLVILDTLRPLLFMDARRGDDLDPVAMTQKLKPFKDLTMRHHGKLTIWFVYHNARTTNEYYGTGAFLNLLDSYWNYTRDLDDTTAEVVIQTRELRHKMRITYLDGKFVQQEKMGIGELCERIIDMAHDNKVSQTAAEKQFTDVANREGVRVAFKHLTDNHVLTNCQKDKRYLTLADDWQERRQTMLGKLGWDNPAAPKNEGRRRGQVPWVEPRQTG